MFISITDVLPTTSHTLFETLNKTRECGTSLIVIHLSSSALTMKENEQQTLKEQLTILLAVLFHSEVPRCRAVEALFANIGLFSVFRNFDGRHRTELVSHTCGSFFSFIAYTTIGQHHPLLPVYLLTHNLFYATGRVRTNELALWLHMCALYDASF